jgi:hypothetical protein
MNVQHWLEDAADNAENFLVSVLCPGCGTMHFINSLTGKLQDDKADE